MQKRNVLHSPRLLELKKRRQKAVIHKILISLLGLSVLFTLLAYLSRLDGLNIADVEITGNKVIDAEELKAVVNEELAGKYLWLFPKTNILFYPKNNIRDELQEKFKRIKDIDLTVKNNKTLFVTISERRASYTWCGNTLPKESDMPDQENGSQQCYFLDEDGYIFDNAAYFSGQVYFKLYGDISDPTPLGAYFSKADFARLISFKEMLGDMELKPISLYVGSDGDAEIFLSKGPAATVFPKILFRTDADFTNVAENLQAALATEPLKSKFKNKYSSLLYIDLRFGNKVYDKFSAPGVSSAGGQ